MSADLGAGDLPDGYRWATPEEVEAHPPEAIVVRRTVDRLGRPYAQDEADIAVPIEGQGGDARTS